MRRRALKPVWLTVASAVVLALALNLYDKGTHETLAALSISEAATF